MKTQIRVSSFFVVALIAGLFGAATRAPAQKGALATIPFAFEANDQQFPGGDYYVRVLTPRLIEVIDRSTGTYKALLLVRPERERDMETRGRMVFLHGDQRYFLTQIRFEGSYVHANLMLQPSLQRELARQKAPAPSTVEVEID